MASDPSRNKPGKDRPEIWSSGGQRPPFDLRALGRASLHLSRSGVVPIHAWAARRLRQAALEVRDGKGRIPAEKLGRAERFVPSHLRVAGWIKSLGATLAHASATADPDVKRGNALVAEIEPHLWTDLGPETPPAEPVAAAGEVGPTVLPEPPPVLQPGDDPLASIRDEIGAGPDPAQPARRTGPDRPPAPPGPVAEAAVQVSGYLIGWGTTVLALPYGFGRALWMWLNGRDLKTIGRED